LSDHPIRLATLREELADLYQALDERGLNAGSAGNVSGRTNHGMQIAPTDARPHAVEPAEVALDAFSAGRFVPPTERPLHAAIYQATPAAMVVVHAHGDHAAAFSSLNVPLPAFHDVMLEFGGDDVRGNPYAPTGTPELSDIAVAALAGRPACLLANHGMVCHGRNARAALNTALELNTLARQFPLARAAGTPRLPTDAEIAAARVRHCQYGQQFGKKRNEIH
jgi:L-fuculose-phosphate aldolase